MGWSWLVLAALVIGHGRHPLAMLSADMISKLCSTEQTQEEQGEISSHELHGSVPQPVEDGLAAEPLLRGRVFDELLKLGAVLIKNLVNGPCGCVAFSVAGGEE